MLKTIEYDYHFSNGATRKFSADLQAGSTMVTGKNGRGKSLILETFSFLLFGVQALRGNAEDYKKISAACRVTIRGKDYAISRTKAKAEVKLIGEDTPLASGTSAVNTFITNLLGYDYNVYRLSNWCAQGEIQALAQMKPKERKEMIDQVAGLNQVDVLIEFIKQEIKLINANIAGIESVASKPLEPTAPTVSKGDLELQKNEYNQLLAQMEDYNNKRKALIAVAVPVQPVEHQLSGFPVRPAPLAPVVKQEPKPFPVWSMAEPVIPELLKTNSRADVEARFETLSQQIEGLIQRKQSSTSKLETLKRTVGEAIHQLENIVQFSVEYWNEQLFYWGQKIAYDNLLKQGDVSCPSCGHRHPVASDALLSYDTTKFPSVQPLDINTIKSLFVINAELQNLATIDNEIVQTFSSPENMAALRSRIPELRAELANYDRAVMDFNRVRESFERDCAHVQQMNDSIEANYQAQCAAQAAREDERLKSWQNECQLIEQNNQRTTAMNAEAMVLYTTELNAYNQAQAGLVELQASFDYDQSFKFSVELKDSLHQGEIAWRVYEQMYAQYEAQMVSYNQVQARLESERAMLEDRQRAGKALNDLKARVKTYLIPSLNKVSSYLLSEMTGGDFNTVNIDEDFEVYVDGQALRTMSGSAKDVTNLALRIGLGRILTHKVLGMMMLDEIDQGMDAERAAYTWQCIERVTPQIGQVLVVSHKDLNAENRLEVA